MLRIKIIVFIVVVIIVKPVKNYSVKVAFHTKHMLEKHVRDLSAISTTNVESINLNSRTAQEVAWTNGMLLQNQI
jgi:translation elongation factor P/translation initiation factor 5A